MFSSVYMTTSSVDEAKEIAKKLLDKKLIACANMFPITSLYYWDDKLCDDSEFAVIMKTRTELLDELIEQIKKNHSYEVPCIVSWDISNGNEDYLGWIEKETM